MSVSALFSALAGGGVGYDPLGRVVPCGTAMSTHAQGQVLGMVSQKFPEVEGVMRNRIG